MNLIFTACVDVLCNPDAFSRCLAAVPQVRREKVGRLRFEKDKRLSLGAALLLRAALRYAGYDPDAAEVGTAENGKPDFVGIPLHFSLSHAGDRVLCALAQTPVGCDTEPVVTAPQGVVKRFFHPQEQAYLAAVPNDRYDRAFYEIWTQKESVIKRCGDGLRRDLRSFSALGDTVTEDDGTRSFLHGFSLPNGYVGAVCSGDAECSAPVTLNLLKGI